MLLYRLSNLQLESGFYCAAALNSQLAAKVNHLVRGTGKSCSIPLGKGLMGCIPGKISGVPDSVVVVNCRGYLLHYGFIDLSVKRAFIISGSRLEIKKNTIVSVLDSVRNRISAY